MRVRFSLKSNCGLTDISLQAYPYLAHNVHKMSWYTVKLNSVSTLEQRYWQASLLAGLITNRWFGGNDQKSGQMLVKFAL